MNTRPNEAREGRRTTATADSVVAKEALAWVQQFARTLKTCRLYDRDNPNVLRFRTDLAGGLSRLLDGHGKITLTFSSTEILCGAVSDSETSFKDEALATTFYRDGIRSLTFDKGIEQEEVDALVDIVLRVSGPRAEDEDLVTLIWDADLTNVTLKYVSIDADVEGGDDTEDGESGQGTIAPWPAASHVGQPADGSPSRACTSEPGGDAHMGRSDDWLTPTTSDSFAGMFDELQKCHRTEVDRFRTGYLAEYRQTNVRTSLELMRDCLEAETGPEDVEDLRRFLFRPLHEALGGGEWNEAGGALKMIRRRGDPSELIESFLQDLCQPNSLTTRNVLSLIDQQGARNVQPFVEFARLLGPEAGEWLMHLLASSERRNTRMALAKTISELCSGKPEQMIPWLSDSRWYVVRNVIHILGRIGGPRILDLIRRASEHEEYRVREEVVTAAAAAGTEEARPILMGMLNSLDTRSFCVALRQLSDRRDPELALILIDQLQDPGFHERAAEERRAVYVAISAVGADEVVPVLEAELNKGNWLTRGPDAHQRAVARCLVHLDTERAHEVLAAGLRSRRRAVRKACEQAMGEDKS